MIGGVVELCAALRARLELLVKDYRLQTDSPDEAPRTFRVIDGWLPPKRGKGPAEAPFIIVRPSKGKTDNAQRTAAVEIIVCTYSEQADGHTDVLNALERIHTGLMTNQTLDNRYRLSLPLEWDLFEDQPAPQWQLVIKTEWVLPKPVEIIEGDD